MSLRMSHVPYKKLQSSIWARSTFHHENLAKSYKIMNKFEKSKKICSAPVQNVENHILNSFFFIVVQKVKLTIFPIFYETFACFQFRWLIKSEI